MIQLANCGRLTVPCLILLSACWLSTATRAAAETPAAPADPIKVLFLGDHGHHQPKVRFDELAPVLQSRGIDMTYTDKLSDLNLENLKKYDALAVYANIDEIGDDQAAAIMTYVTEGGGYVPLHCASFCFRNHPELVALTGAEFQRHGTGVFRTDIAKPDHEVMKGFGGFESWDETYVHHLHNNLDRTVLAYRVDAEGREPYTWIRTQGKGRVFYTAWGHDARTFRNPGFENLIERGIRWASHRDPQAAGDFLADTPFPVPEMNAMPKDLKPFEFADVGNEIPNYRPSTQWGVQGKPLSSMQKPIEPTESMKHMLVPEGFHLELFVSEPDLQGKPICMSWDEQGRLWVAETLDYPNELRPPGEGRDRIRICEDTDGDNKADKFTVFAEDLSIPTSIAFVDGGVIVQDATRTLRLEDTDGDDVADKRDVIVSNWQLGDTHGGVSNFQYGLDNWIWAMQGYNDSQPESQVEPDDSKQSFRQGFFRMRPDGSDIEFIRSTNNNTWGLGISEEGLIFGSTANANPSIYMPIPNRYYERVRGWTPSLTLSSIADTYKFQPITENVRQVDQFGGYTAGAGHALYTAREYPQEYWNRVAFVNGPTGHLTGAFVLKAQGSDFSSTSPFNLVASDDEWTAPIMAEVGPDGQVWVIDWYNYIVQHNPTPQGFKTGKGAAYETKLRDKKHGRIYRVVADASKPRPIPNLAEATPQELVAALADPTQLIRKHAQRLLVERGEHDVVADLVKLVQDDSTDEIGLNVGAIHALWTLHGLGALDEVESTGVDAAYAALSHPSAGVRRNAVAVLPRDPASVQAILDAKLLQDSDAQVRLATLLALSDLPATVAGAAALMAVAANPTDMSDRWLPDALTSAAANNSSEFLASLADAKALPDQAYEIISRVAEHYARGDDVHDAARVLARLGKADRRATDAVLAGLSQGWKAGRKVELSDETETQLKNTFDQLSPGSQGTFVKLATQWGSKNFAKFQQEIAERLLATVADQDASEEARIDAASQAIEFMNDDAGTVEGLLDEIKPQTPPAVSLGIISAVGLSQWEGAGGELVSKLNAMTPGLKQAGIVQLLQRPASTMALLDGIESGDLRLDELALDQRQSLNAHPSEDVRTRAKELMAGGGAMPNADRQKVLDQYMVATEQTGDVDQGKEVFKVNCSKCHVHGDLGAEVGPNLTGMAVHPKDELLVHILDPSRSVEGNFRAYTVLTADGLVLNGMLASESKTAIELFDTEGKKQSVLREDIDELVMSPKSIMPEGFESAITPEQMTNLLEFLTLKGRYVPIPLGPIATAISTSGLFSGSDNGPDRLIFSDWKPKQFKGISFELTDPQGKSKPNIIVLQGPNSPNSARMPKSVSLPCNTPVTAIHLLSGVSGWGAPYDNAKSVSMIVRLHYADGETEDHPLKNAVEFADYIRRVDVPGSEFAFVLEGGQQIRYLSVKPERTEKIDTIELVKGPDRTAPIVMAVTIEPLAGNAPEH